jgi:hypothetical protein
LGIQGGGRLPGEDEEAAAGRPTTHVVHEDHARGVLEVTGRELVGDQIAGAAVSIGFGVTGERPETFLDPIEDLAIEESLAGEEHE